MSRKLPSAPLPLHFFPLVAFYGSKDIFGSSCSLTGTSFSPESLSKSLNTTCHMQASSHGNLKYSFQGSPKGASVSFRIRSLELDSFKLVVSCDQATIVCIETAFSSDSSVKCWILNGVLHRSIPQRLRNICSQVCLYLKR